MNRNRKSSLLGIAMVMALGIAQIGVVPAFAQTDTTAQEVDLCILYGTDDEATDTIEATAESEIGEQEDQMSEADEVDSAQDDEHDAETEDGDEADGEDEADDAQEPAYVGSIALDEAMFDGMTDAEECTALISLATVTVDEARAAAEAETGSIAVKVEIDDENGYLVYSVEMEDGSEVTVDAGNAAILHIEPQDTEEAA